MFVVEAGSIEYANHAVAQFLGRAVAEIVGRSPLEFVHSDDRDRVEHHFCGLIRGEAEEGRVSARCVRPDGIVVSFELLTSRLIYGGRAAILGTMVDISALKEAEQAMEERIRFERLLAELSASFVNIPVDKIDLQIEGWLRTLVEFLGNDRSSCVEFTEDERQVLVTHSYATRGCQPFPLGPFAVERLPWFIGQFRSGETVFVKSVPDDLPPEASEERAYCAAQGIQSNVTLPLKAGGKVLGGITFAFLSRRCEWPIEIISRLRLIGEVFANALLRRRADEALRTALAENQKLRQQLEQENLLFREQYAPKHRHRQIIGHSEAITRVLYYAERVAATDTPVLLSGETGTGKELLAQRIHELSPRKGRPMVAVNCASLPATLVESELFGREAGAYTGAASAQIGRFVLADGSTLFLDEIGEFPLELQAKLLRVLQDGRFERLGSPKTVKVNVRIIAATNRDLERAVREGTFRLDLYHRLRVFPIHVPPLRERRDDIPPLVWAFVESFGRRMGKSIKSISRRTMQRLQQYSWPGNVRELSNVIERAMILAGGDTLNVDLPVDVRDPAAPPMTLKETEKGQIDRVLRDTGWRIRGEGGAAELLGLKPTTLEARMAKLGIRRPQKRSTIT